MRAITIRPETPNSIRLDDVPEPPTTDGAVLVHALALGVCGTDREIIAGEYGEAPDGHDRLILGHESLGRVIAAPDESDLAPGDHVVGIVRHPDPLPCPACASGQWDMCRNGQYTEHGIKRLNGFGAERWRTPQEFAVKVDRSLGILGVLLEPASVVAKAWDHVDRVWRLEAAPPRRALITGAGPIGLLAALMGVQRRHDVHIFDRNADGPKPALTRALGAAYHSGAIEDLAPLMPDVVICLAGVGGSHRADFNMGLFNRNMVLNNGTVFGTVNANLRHYRMAAASLARADRAWLERLITRRVPLARFSEAFEHRKDDIKVVIEFA